MFRSITLSSAFLFLAGTGSAQDIGGAAVGFGLSSFGAYASASYEVAPKLRLRGIVTGLPSFEFDDEGEETGSDITFDGSFGGVAALADYHPYAGSFRVSGGLFFSNSSLDGNGQGFEAEDGTSYDNARVDGSLRFEEEIAPMLAIGYVTGGERSWGFESEIGLIGVGGVEVTLDGTSGDPTVDTQFQEDLEEVEADAQEMGDMLVVYPWLSIGVSYRF
ncbi:hypothetical protein [Limimaricola cinnabarinus]|uniref:Outer membrane protein beta-barrel domain-containing protein n=1 Tax=Limimaricola cinnabarinus LL-001 TaxID=1337093 RepID=U3AH92_9RHOB|nr:hypothetical protein [Limimaricola cinnabarinus]GAD54163.1 hypothetical protein MBELCI_0215 [Limimaricola cinnabarinus LL-001]